MATFTSPVVRESRATTVRIALPPRFATATLRATIRSVRPLFLTKLSDWGFYVSTTSRGLHPSHLPCWSATLRVSNASIRSPAIHYPAVSPTPAPSSLPLPRFQRLRRYLQRRVVWRSAPTAISTSPTHSTTISSSLTARLASLLPTDPQSFLVTRTAWSQTLV